MSDKQTKYKQYTPWVMTGLMLLYAVSSHVYLDLTSVALPALFAGLKVDRQLSSLLFISQLSVRLVNRGGTHQDAKVDLLYTPTLFTSLRTAA